MEEEQEALTWHFDGHPETRARVLICYEDRYYKANAPKSITHEGRSYKETDPELKHYIERNVTTAIWDGKWFSDHAPSDGFGLYEFASPVLAWAHFPSVPAKLQLPALTS